MLQTSSSSRKSSFKILYIQQSVDGRASVRKLEESTASLDFICFFTVVPDVFVAVDFMENTRFDLTIANYELPHCNALEMVQTLRSAGSTIPIVLITGTDEEVGGSDSTSHENHVAVDEESCQRYVWTILKRPFPPSDLLQVIVSIKREADLLHTAAKVNDDDSRSLLIDLPQRDGAASQDVVR
eukprot:gene3511-3847_t